MIGVMLIHYLVIERQKAAQRKRAEELKALTPRTRDLSGSRVLDGQEAMDYLFPEGFESGARIGANDNQ